jgi:4-hydroxy-2-oxoheptanedioate aldolase
VTGPAQRGRGASGAPRIGTVLSLPDPVLAELAGAALDLAWIDLEHGALSHADVPALAIALRAAGCEAHVRLPDAAPAGLGPVLDAGVAGVVAPCVERPEQAAALAAALRYPPHGVRGYGPRRAGGYGRTPRFWAAPAARVSLAVQIESRAGVGAAAAIAAVDGVDALVVGCADLSLALGVPMDLRAGPLRSAVTTVERATRGAGRAFGLAASGDPGAIAALAPPGTGLVISSADVRLYAAGVDAAAAGLRSALAERAGKAAA